MNPKENEHIPIKKRNVFHINDQIELTGDGFITATFQEELVPVNESPNWVNSADELVIRTLRMGGRKIG